MSEKPEVLRGRTFIIHESDVGREAMFYDEHVRVLKSHLAEREQRIAELEAALRECIYAVLHGDGTVPPSARAALAATEGEKR